MHFIIKEGMLEVEQKQQKQRQEPRAIIIYGKRNNANLKLLLLLLSWLCSVSGCGNGKPNSSLSASMRIINYTLTAKSLNSGLCCSQHHHSF